jgi:tetratricopeptide (TPR) repeat protein
MATVTWLPHLVADFRLARAVAATEGGQSDPGVVATLRASIRAEPSPDALRRLAWHENVAKRPEVALAVVEDLLVISPYDELGRIERARALRSLKRLDEARALLDDLVAARPGDDVSLMLRGLVRGEQGDREGALPDILDAMKAAPPDAARRYAALVHRGIASFEPAVIRMAERIGKEQPARALAILEGIGTGEADYYRALVYVAIDQPTEAVRALRASISSQFVTTTRLVSDPRLDPIRNHPEFVALVGGR